MNREEIYCFISVIQLELREPSAKMWIALTCCSIAGVVGALVSVPSPSMQKHSYELKPPQIEIKELPEATPLNEAEKLEDTANTEKKVVVVASELYVRVEANPNAQVLGSVKYGQTLIVLDDPADMDWVNIRTDSGLTGWVAKSYVGFIPEEPEQHEDSV